MQPTMVYFRQSPLVKDHQLVYKIESTTVLTTATTPRNFQSTFPQQKSTPKLQAVAGYAQCLGLWKGFTGRYGSLFGKDEILFEVDPSHQSHEDFSRKSRNSFFLCLDCWCSLSGKLTRTNRNHIITHTYSSVI